MIFSVIGLNAAFTQPIIKIWGSVDSPAIHKQVVNYLNYLDVQEKIFLSVGITKNIPRGMKGMTFSVTTPKSQTSPIIKVLINAQLDEEELRVTLAHEMVHVKQYAKGKLAVFDEHQLLWEGRKVAYRRASYDRLSPWELEAHRLDHRLVKLFDQREEVLLARERFY